MIKINNVSYDGQTIKLAIPVYMSEDEVMGKDYDSHNPAATAAAFFLFNIIQKEIAQIMANREEEQ